MSEIIEYKEIYDRDDNDNIRVWKMQREGNAFRAVSGVENGKMVFSGWKYAEGKNPGKKNETTPDDQAHKEILAQYKKRLERGYSETKDGAGAMSFFAPMLAGKHTGKEKFPFYAQPKLDGMRCVANKAGLWSRNGKPIVSAPHIHAALGKIFDLYPNLVLDGELYNHALKDDFDKIMSLARKGKPTAEDLAESAGLLEYHVYDLPTIDGTVGDSFGDRFKSLADLIQLFVPEKVVLVETHYVRDEITLDELYAKWLEDRYEGQMIRLTGKYEVGSRSDTLLKRKEFIDEEFEIAEIQEGIGNWAGKAKRVIYWLPDRSDTFESGLRGSFDYTTRLLAEKELYVGGIGTVRYQNLTPGGKPRFAVTLYAYKNSEEKL